MSSVVCTCLQVQADAGRADKRDILPLLPCSLTPLLPCSLAPSLSFLASSCSLPPLLLVFPCVLLLLLLLSSFFVVLVFFSSSFCCCSCRQLSTLRLLVFFCLFASSQGRCHVELCAELCAELRAELCAKVRAKVRVCAGALANRHSDIILQRRGASTAGHRGLAWRASRKLQPVRLLRFGDVCGVNA